MEQVRTTTSKWEKFCYGLGDCGGAFVWNFVGSFLLLYYTDSVMISAATVGTIMLVVRLFDGVSDIIMGVIIENTATKMGKCRPWFGRMMVPLVVSLLLTYNVPGALGMTGKTVYAFITYFLLAVVCYTATELAWLSMLPRISLEKNDQVKTTAVRSIMGFIMALVIVVLANTLLAAFGGEKQQSSWTKISFIYAAISIVMMVIAFLGVKEKIPAEKKPKEQGGVPLKTGVKTLLCSKYFYISLLIFIIIFIVMGITNGGAIYYARDVLGDSGLYNILAVGYVLASVVGMVIAPAIVKKTSKRTAMMLGAVIGIVGSLVSIINPRSLIFLMIGVMIKGAGLGFFNSIIYTLAPDLVEILQEKTGELMEGIATASNSIGTKVGTGLGTAILGWTLAFGQYDGAALVQAESVVQAEIFGYLWLPLILIVALLILAFLWDYEKKKAAGQKAVVQE